MRYLASIHTIFVLLLLWFSSCKDDGLVTDNPNYDLITSISGTVNGLPSYAKVLKAVVRKSSAELLINSDTIGNDHVMNFNLPVPPQQYLINIGQFLTSTGGTTVISDKTINVNLLSIEVYDSLNRNAGFILKDNHHSNNELFPGYVSVSALYSDGSLSVTGRSIEVLSGDTTIMAYNANLSKGWNVISVRIKDIRTRFIEFEFFNGEYLPSGAAWYYYPPSLNILNRILRKE